MTPAVSSIGTRVVALLDTSDDVGADILDRGMLRRVDVEVKQRACAMFRRVSFTEAAYTALPPILRRPTNSYGAVYGGPKCLTAATTPLVTSSIVRLIPQDYRRLARALIAFAAL